jgi:sucrose-6-phosphate hydrolase SacC (GH32 family)
MYVGLVQDHNNNWATEFKRTPTTYETMLDSIIKELEVELYKLEPPSIKDLKSKKEKKVKKKKALETEGKENNLELVDVEYKDKVEEIKEIDVEADEVKDRWSRYIGAMGIDAVRKQAVATVLMLGANALGVELAKNVVLSGVKRFVI